MKVAYLGPPGTFTEKVAKQVFPNLELTPFSIMSGVVFAVENKKTDYGVVPLENFYNGDVRPTLDALRKCIRTKIIAERALQVVHCLGVLPGVRKIEYIYSKDQALEQCGDYLFRNFPEANEIPVSSTSEAAQRVVRENLLEAAAIAPKETLIQAGLEVIAEDLCPNNKTRFAVIARENTQPTGNDKTLLAFNPPEKDRSGILCDLLGYFKALEINITSLFTRPDVTPTRRGYWFYIEVQAHERDRKLLTAIRGIRNYLDPTNKIPFASIIKSLGSYRDSKWVEI